MTTATKCRAKGGVTKCTNPNCPEKRGGATQQDFINQRYNELRQHLFETHGTPEQLKQLKQAEYKESARNLLRKQIKLGNVSYEGEKHIKRLKANLSQLAKPVVSDAARREGQQLAYLGDKYPLTWAA